MRPRLRVPRGHGRRRARGGRHHRGERDRGIVRARGRRRGGRRSRVLSTIAIPRRQRVRRTVVQLGDWRDLLSAMLPGIALVGMLLWARSLQPGAISYDGLELLLASGIPLMFAAVSQMFVIVVGDID